MKINTLLTGIGLMLLSVACKEASSCCDVLPGNDEHFEYSVKNKAGVDLLAPDATGSYNSPQITILENDNGKFVEIYRPDRDTPKGYKIFKHENTYRMRLFIEATESTGDFVQKQAIVRWNETDQDTVKLRLSLQNGNIQHLVQIHYNNQNVWDGTTSSDHNERYFEVVK
jgi:hypothetical protein